MVADNFSIEFSRDQAIVLFEWLVRTDVAGKPAAFEDQAEQRALWDLGASLESALTEPLREDFHEVLEAARERLRDPTTECSSISPGL